MDVSLIRGNFPRDERNPLKKNMSIVVPQLEDGEECQESAHQIDKNENAHIDEVALLDVCDDRRIYAHDLGLGGQRKENAASPISSNGIDLNLGQDQKHKEPQAEISVPLVYGKPLLKNMSESPCRTRYADYALDGLQHSHPKTIFSVALCKASPTNEDLNEVDLQLTLASPAIYDPKCRVSAAATRIVNLDLKTGGMNSGTSSMLDATGLTWKTFSEESATSRRTHGFFVGTQDQTCDQLENESLCHVHKTGSHNSQDIQESSHFFECKKDFLAEADAVPCPEMGMHTTDMSTKEQLWPGMYQPTRSEQHSMLEEAQRQSNLGLKHSGIMPGEQYEPTSRSLEQMAKNGPCRLAGQFDLSSHKQDVASSLSKRLHKISEGNAPKLGVSAKEYGEKTTENVGKPHIWIQRWHPNTKDMSYNCLLSIKRKSTTSLTFELNKNKDDDRYGLFYSFTEAKNNATVEYQGLESFKVRLTKTLPSVTAMAIVGTAAKRFCSSQHQWKGWTTKER